jgi:hypothetical protein
MEEPLWLDEKHADFFLILKQGETCRSVWLHRVVLQVMSSFWEETLQGAFNMSYTWHVSSIPLAMLWIQYLYQPDPMKSILLETAQESHNTCLQLIEMGYFLRLSITDTLVPIRKRFETHSHHSQVHPSTLHDMTTTESIPKRKASVHKRNIWWIQEDNIRPQRTRRRLRSNRIY